MAAAGFLCVLLIASPLIAFAKDHTVGGSDGWSQSGDYSSWAAGETFNVGDNLVFNYMSNHGVDIVSKADYESCNTGNALQTFTGGQTTIPLSSSGDMYFICSTPGHCDTGMKLAIKVQGSSSGTTPATPSGSGATPAKSNHPNAASGAFGSMSKLVVGFSVVFGSLFVFMG